MKDDGTCHGNFLEDNVGAKRKESFPESTTLETDLEDQGGLSQYVNNGDRV